MWLSEFQEVADPGEKKEKGGDQYDSQNLRTLPVHLRGFNTPGKSLHPCNRP
jgi:hypothetical protein